MALNEQNKSKAPSPPEVAATVPDAVIFIPGITHEPSQYPIDEISLLLANALNNADKIGRAKFRVGKVGTDSLANSGDTQTTTIFREQDGQEVAVVKVYGMNYNSEILGRYQDMPPLLKFLSLPLTFIPLSRTWIPSIRNKSLSSQERWQFRLLGIVLFLMFLYSVLLITSVVGSIAAFQDNSANTDSAGTTEPLLTATAIVPSPTVAAATQVTPTSSN